jgi:GT2 family glycosyltransferase
MGVSATILITTKDRKEELRRALQSAMGQIGATEILVFDDGSTDGTGEMIRKSFPGVRYERSERSLGIVGARNRAVSLANGSIVVTIDDDCVFGSPHTVAQTLDDFRDAGIAAVAIPHIQVNGSPIVYCLAPQRDRAFAISEFTGCASAVRRDVFLQLGGFRSALWRQGEESDFCTRLLEVGFFTCCGTADPILHRESLSRDRGLMAFHFVRGNLLYVWYNVPFPYALPHFAVTALRVICNGIRSGNGGRAFSGALSALQEMVRDRRSRKPVRANVYRLVRQLRRKGPIPVELVRKRLSTESRPSDQLTA